MSPGHEKRWSSRFDCRLACEIHFFVANKQATCQQGVMLNISPKGAMIRCETALPLESVILLTLSEPRAISLGAQVVRVVDNPDGGCFVGIRAIEDWPYSTFAELFFHQRDCSSDEELDELFR